MINNYVDSLKQTGNAQSSVVPALN